MESITTYKHYATALITSIKKPLVIIPALGIVELSNSQMGLGLLFVLLLTDYLTGVLASWVKFKKEHKEGSFFKSKEGFSSDMSRKTFVKVITYFLFILCTHFIQQIFQIKSFSSDYSSIKDISITLFAIALSCGVEFYSIFFENLPDAGFSIEKSYKKIFNKVKSIYQDIKNFSNEKTTNPSSDS